MPHTGVGGYSTGVDGAPPLRISVECHPERVKRAEGSLRCERKGIGRIIALCRMVVWWMFNGRLITAPTGIGYLSGFVGDGKQKGRRGPSFGMLIIYPAELLLSAGQRWFCRL